MVDILFINSVTMYYSPDSIPSGILSLVSVLEKKYTVSVLDFSYLYHTRRIKKSENYDIDIEAMSEYILNINPSIVGFYTMCDSYHISIRLSQLLKEKNSSIKILLGGPHASLTAVETMKAFPWIDAIGIGECENSIESIVHALKHNECFSNICGVVYRKKNDVIVNKTSPLMNNLDEIPFLDYSYINIDKIKQDFKNTRFPIEVGRGCPFNCTFCSTKTFWKRKFRLKSSDRILHEIRTLRDCYGIDNFRFTHDLFTFNNAKTIEFCDILISEDLNIRWECSARLDTLNEHLIMKMSLAGCDCIYLGIESGSQRMQRILNKNLDLTNINRVVDNLNKHNIEPIVSFIYGFPEETMSDIQDTLNLIHELSQKKIKHIQLHLLAILPGTELFETTKNNLEFSNYFSDICDNDAVTPILKSIICDNPNIFPQFFEYKTELRNQLTNLDRFVNAVYPYLRKSQPELLKCFMDFYNNDLLQFFIELKSSNWKISKLALNAKS